MASGATATAAPDKPAQVDAVAKAERILTPVVCFVEVRCRVLFGSRTAVFGDAVVDSAATILVLRADGAAGAHHGRAGHSDHGDQSKSGGCETHLKKRLM